MDGGALMELKVKKPKAVLFRTIFYNNEYYLFSVKVANN